MYGEIFRFTPKSQTLVIQVEKRSVLLSKFNLHELWVKHGNSAICLPNTVELASYVETIASPCYGNGGALLSLKLGAVGDEEQ